jgi:hypothetical protein
MSKKKYGQFMRSARKQKLRMRREFVESLAFKLRYYLEDSGDVAPQEDGSKKPVRMEIQNDPKYLLGIMNGIDTAKDPYKSRRRTIMRLFSSCTKVARDWARSMKDTDIPDEEQDFVLEIDIPISPEGMEFLKELVEKPPEGAKYQSIPVQHLLVSIEDQYNEWKSEKPDGAVAESEQKPPA